MIKTAKCRTGKLSVGMGIVLTFIMGAVYTSRGEGHDGNAGKSTQDPDERIYSDQERFEETCLKEL